METMRTLAGAKGYSRGPRDTRGGQGILIGDLWDPMDDFKTPKDKYFVI